MVEEEEEEGGGGVGGLEHPAGVMTGARTHDGELITHIISP